jgi:hypothetical protein
MGLHWAIWLWSERDFRAHHSSLTFSIGWDAAHDDTPRCRSSSQRQSQSLAFSHRGLPLGAYRESEGEILLNVQNPVTRPRSMTMPIGTDSIESEILYLRSRICSLEQCVCELLSKNERLRSALFADASRNGSIDLMQPFSALYRLSISNEHKEAAISCSPQEVSCSARNCGVHLEGNERASVHQSKQMIRR